MIMSTSPENVILWSCYSFSTSKNIRELRYFIDATDNRKDLKYSWISFELNF